MSLRACFVPLTVLAILTGPVPLAQTSVARAESLGAAVRSALTAHPEVKARDAEVRATIHDLARLRGEYQPTVTLRGGLGAEYVDDPTSLSAADNAETKLTSNIGVEAEVVLFDGLRRANRVYANAARVDGTYFQMLDASESMALNAVEAYIDVLRHGQLLDVAQRNLRRHREIRRQVGELVDGGRIPASDALQVDDRLIAAEMAVIDVREAREIAAARYAAVIGHAPAAPMSYGAAPGLPGQVGTLVRNAVQNSFRVGYYNSLIDQRAFEREAADADYKPRLSLNAGASVGSNLGGSRGEETEARIGLNLRWNLYNGGRSAQVAAAGERRNKALYQRMAAIRDVEELSRRAWAEYRSAVEMNLLLDRQLRTNRQIVRQYDEEFQASKRTLLDVLEAERVFHNTLFQQVGAEASRRFAEYRLIGVQSRLAAHFGVKPSLTALDAPRDVVSERGAKSLLNQAIPPLRSRD
ncbi:TolC family protein [Pseudooceanicola aestuarii]|uniref:TolC family protein n=1 Tax=Pseudooceanicola aestuarii TaxID=2697319 RepID=UPI0013D3C3B2|nr:TolC family protein [Pseudooceanicola aestuarii]